MAIQTVTNDNLADYAASKAERPNLSNADQVTEAVKDVRKLGTPVVKETTETISDSPDPGEQTPTGSKPKGVQPRIDELTRLRKEAEEFAEGEWKMRVSAEHRIAELEAALKAAKPVEAPKVEEIKRPRLSDFQQAADFDAAMDKYESEREKQVQERVRAETQQQLAQEAQNRAITERYETARKDFPDFDEVIAKANRAGLNPSGHLQAAMRESEYGVHMAYHFAKHPEDLRRLEGLSPVRAVAELGKLELKYVKAEAEPEKDKPKPSTIETTRAPEPVSGLKGDSGVVKSDLTGLDFQEYKRRRLDESRRSRGR